MRRVANATEPDVRPTGWGGALGDCALRVSELRTAPDTETLTRQPPSVLFKSEVSEGGASWRGVRIWRGQAVTGVTWLVVGEDDAELYRKYGDELVRFASALVGPTGAEDVVATAVLACFSTSRWPTVTNRRAYLYRAVLNQALKSRRRAEHRLAAEMELAATRDEPDPGLGVDVIRALRQLSMRQRAVMFLTYWEELSAAEAATTLGLSLRTVERELAAGRTRLRRLLS